MPIHFEAPAGVHFALGQRIEAQEAGAAHSPGPFRVCRQTVTDNAGGKHPNMPRSTTLRTSGWRATRSPSTGPRGASPSRRSGSRPGRTPAGSAWPNSSPRRASCAVRPRRSTSTAVGRRRGRALPTVATSPGGRHDLRRNRRAALSGVHASRRERINPDALLKSRMLPPARSRIHDLPPLLRPWLLDVRPASDQGAGALFAPLQRRPGGGHPSRRRNPPQSPGWIDQAHRSRRVARHPGGSQIRIGLPRRFGLQARGRDPGRVGKIHNSRRA